MNLFNNNGGPITIDIRINGANIWSYEYVGDSIFKNKRYCKEILKITKECRERLLV
jgi:hypothetical protein